MCRLDKIFGQWSTVYSPDHDYKILHTTLLEEPRQKPHMVSAQKHNSRPLMTRDDPTPVVPGPDTRAKTSSLSNCLNMILKEFQLLRACTNLCSTSDATPQALHRKSARF